jgi:disulfide bond formation protein DsbB
MKLFLQKYILPLAFVQALIATLGSLYFSEIAHFIPCTLCWYQRICMYPLTVILAVGILEKNKKIYRYVFPISIVGWIIAFYHNLIQYNFIPETIKTCSVIGSCTERYIDWYGFITIPLMSLTAFTVINIYMIIFKKYFSK